MLADNDSCEMDDYSQWIKGHPVAAIEQAGEDQKWINHCRLSMQYKFNFTPSAELEDPAGTAIFYRVWREKWRGLIRIRRASQHSRCAECVKYCVYRQKAKTEEERNKIQEAYNSHLAQVFADREQGRRLSYMSEMSCRISSSIPPSKRILYLQVDGMDQAWCSNFSKTETINLAVSHRMLCASFTTSFWPGQIQMSAIWSKPSFQTRRKAMEAHSSQCGHHSFWPWRDILLGRLR